MYKSLAPQTISVETEPKLQAPAPDSQNWLREREKDSLLSQTSDSADLLFHFQKDTMKVISIQKCNYARGVFCLPPLISGGLTFQRVNHQPR